MTALVLTPNRTEIEDVIHTFCRDWSGIKAIWAEQGGPQPALPYLSLKIISSPQLGMGAIPGGVEVDGEDFSRKLARLKELVVSVQAFGIEGLAALEALIMAMDAEAARIALGVKNVVAVGPLSEVKDLSFLQETVRRERYQVDLVFRVGVSTDEDITATGGYIQAVTIEENTTAEGGSELDSGPVTIGTPVPPPMNINQPWDYVLDEVSSPWKLGLGDPSIAAGKLVLTTNDIVLMTAALSGSYMLRHTAEFSGDYVLFTTQPSAMPFYPTNVYPSIFFNESPMEMRLGGSDYNSGVEAAFGTWAPEVIGSVYVVEVGLFVKATAKQMAMIVKVGPTQFRSGFVNVDEGGGNIRIPELINGTASTFFAPGTQILIGTVTGADGLTDDQVQVLYDSGL